MKGLELRKIRLENKLNQEQMGQILGVSRNTLIIWEKSEKLNDKAERLVIDFLAEKGVKEAIEFAENETDNYLEYKRIAKELKKENAQLKKENSELKDRLIECLSNK